MASSNRLNTPAIVFLKYSTKYPAYKVFKSKYFLVIVFKTLYLKYMVYFLYFTRKYKCLPRVQVIHMNSYCNTLLLGFNNSNFSKCPSPRLMHRGVVIKHPIEKVVSCYACWWGNSSVQTSDAGKYDLQWICDVKYFTVFLKSIILHLHKYKILMHDKLYLKYTEIFCNNIIHKKYFRLWPI